MWKVQCYQIHYERRESLLTKTIVSLNEFAYRVPQNSENLAKDFTYGVIVSTLKADWRKGRGHKCRPKGQANLADCSVNATKLLDIKSVENWTQSGQGEIEAVQGNRKDLKFCSWVSENENAILNIDNVVSLEHSTRVKFVMLWTSSKADVRVPARSKGNHCASKKRCPKKLAVRC